MKNIKSKLLVLLLALLVSTPMVRAQYVRLSSGFTILSNHSSDLDSEKNFNYTPQFELSYEQILSQRLSVSLGANYKMVEFLVDEGPFYYSYNYRNYSGPRYTSHERLEIPLSLEYKVRLGDNLRFLIIGGLHFGWNHGFDYQVEDTYTDFLNSGKTWEDEGYVYDANQNDAAKYCGFNPFTFGARAGAGFEVGNLRFYLLYQRDFMKTAEYSDNFDNSDYQSAYSDLSFNFGYRFGGNKLYKTKSKAKSGTANYPILESGKTVTVTKPAATTTVTTTTAATATKATTKTTTTKAVVAEPTTEVAAAPTYTSSPSAAIISDKPETFKYIRVGLNLAKMTSDYESSYYKNGRKAGYYFGYGFHKPFDKVENLYWGMEYALSSRGYSEKWDFDGEKANDYLMAHSIVASPFNIGYKYQLPYDLKLDLHLGIFASYDYAGNFGTKYSDYPEDDFSISITDYNGFADYKYLRIDAGLTFGFGVWYQDKYNFEFAFQNGLVNTFQSDLCKSHNFMIRVGRAF